VAVTKDPSSNTTKVTGYCIDVFDAVVKALPYALPYEYIPHAMPAGTYDDLAYQVYLKVKYNYIFFVYLFYVYDIALISSTLMQVNFFLLHFCLLRTEL
jgi:hypothetical protein